MNQQDSGGIQVISRAASILWSLEREPDGLSLGEIAGRVQLARSTVQRIVAALVDEQLLIPASRKAGFKLGPALLRLGAAADVGTERLVRPLMLDLSRRADETVDLSVLRRHTARFVDQVQGTQRLAAVSAVGVEFPLHCTANGKALLGLLPPQARQRALSGPLKRYTNATVTDRSALNDHLTNIESTGLAYDQEEHTIGICAIGTAFRDSLGRGYALSIPVPAARFAAKRPLLERLLGEVRAELPDRIA